MRAAPSGARGVRDGSLRSYADLSGRYRAANSLDRVSARGRLRESGAVSSRHSIGHLRRLRRQRSRSRSRDFAERQRSATSPLLWNPSLGLRSSCALGRQQCGQDCEFGSRPRKAGPAAWLTLPTSRRRTASGSTPADPGQSRGPHPWPRFAVFPSFTLRVNEPAAELAFVPRSAVRCSRRARSTPRPPATPEAGPPSAIRRPRSLAEEVDQQRRGASSRSEDRGPVSQPRPPLPVDSLGKTIERLGELLK
jgi:hypothetical protein